MLVEEMTQAELVQEAKILITGTAVGLPRLSALLAALGHADGYSACLNLQYQLAPLVLPPRRSRRRKK